MHEWSWRICLYYFILIIFWFTRFSNSRIDLVEVTTKQLYIYNVGIIPRILQNETKIKKNIKSAEWEFRGRTSWWSNCMETVLEITAKKKPVLSLETFTYAFCFYPSLKELFKIIFVTSATTFYPSKNIFLSSAYKNIHKVYHKWG